MLSGPGCLVPRRGGLPVHRRSPARYSFQLATEDGLMLSGPGCLVPRRGGLPVHRRSPTQALTGPGVE